MKGKWVQGVMAVEIASHSEGESNQNLGHCYGEYYRDVRDVTSIILIAQINGYYFDAAVASTYIYTLLYTSHKCVFSRYIYYIFKVNEIS